MVDRNSIDHAHRVRDASNRLLSGTCADAILVASELMLRMSREFISDCGPGQRRPETIAAMERRDQELRRLAAEHFSHLASCAARAERLAAAWERAARLRHAPADALALALRKLTAEGHAPISQRRIRDILSTR